MLFDLRSQLLGSWMVAYWNWVSFYGFALLKLVPGSCLPIFSSKMRSVRWALWKRSLGSRCISLRSSNVRFFPYVLTDCRWRPSYAYFQVFMKLGHGPLYLSIFLCCLAADQLISTRRLIAFVELQNIKWLSVYSARPHLSLNGRFAFFFESPERDLLEISNRSSVVKRFYSKEFYYFRGIWMISLQHSTE